MASALASAIGTKTHELIPRKLHLYSQGWKTYPPPTQRGASLQLFHQVLLRQYQPLSQQVHAAQQSTENGQGRCQIFHRGKYQETQSGE